MGADPDDEKRSREASERDRAGDAIAESYRWEPQSDEDDQLAMSSAIALTESESLADGELEPARLSDEEAMEPCRPAGGHERIDVDDPEAMEPVWDDARPPRQRGNES